MKCMQKIIALSFFNWTLLYFILDNPVALPWIIVQYFFQHGANWPLIDKMWTKHSEAIFTMKYSLLRGLLKFKFYNAKRHLKVGWAWTLIMHFIKNLILIQIMLSTLGLATS